MSGIVFDLDGTLIDSAPDIHRTSTIVMREEGLGEPSFEQVRGFIGNGIGVLISRCIAAAGAEETPDLHARMARRFEEIYETDIRLTTLYPGVTEALEGLARDGFRLGLCTNKPEGPTHAVLRHFGIDRHFEAFACGDGAFPRKPDPAPLRHVVDQLEARHFLFVGDSETDSETAQRAGLPFALYTEGYRKTPVDALYHDAHFAHFADLRGIVDRIAPRPE